MKNVGIIIPCFNEEESLPMLFQKLKELDQMLASQYHVKFTFVDDGSKDQTFPILENKVSELKQAQVVRHLKNQNLGAAIKTGIAATPGCDYLAFLDSDCTYQPRILQSMLQKLEIGFDLVTVSPYHPMGGVEGVPEWRLFLSKGLSLMYRLILGADIYTWTAMVRVIRAEKMPAIISPSNDFSFMAESFIKAVRLRYKIVEVPCILSVRQFGVSKMNIVRTIKSHLKIIGNLLRGVSI